MPTVFPPEKGIVKIEKGRFGELIGKLGERAEAKMRSVYTTMGRDRRSRLFFLLNPKQIAATEAKIFLAGEEEVRLVTFPFEAGFLASMNFFEAEESEVLARIRVMSSPSSTILGSYVAVVHSIRDALVALTGKRVSSTDSLDVIAGAVMRNRSVFKRMETSRFCLDCGRYVVSGSDVEIEIPCEEKHRFIETSVYKIDDVIMLAWEEGIIFEGYVASLLGADGWDTTIGSEVVGTYGSSHEIDVLAEKNDNYLIVECKHLAPYNEVPYDSIMLSFGKMAVVEEALIRGHRERRRKIGKVLKAFVTTGKLTKTKEVRTMLMEIPDFLVAEREDVVDRLRGLRNKLGQIIE